MSEPLPEDLARAYETQPALATAWPLTHLRETSSTNDVALTLAHGGAAVGTVVVADAQSAGRGRRGRQWSSPPGAGLYVSLILPNISTGREPASPWMTPMAGLAAAAAIRRVSRVEVSLKWPNDLVVHRVGTAPTHWRKLGGLLAEGVSDGSRLKAVVVGVGINLRHAAHAPEVSAISTSIEREQGQAVDRGELLVSLLEELGGGLQQLREGRVAELRASFLAWSPLSSGGRVMWSATDGPREGVASGVDEDGALLVRTPDGVERLVSGDVRWEQHGTLG